MRYFLCAVQFLTCIPVRIKKCEDADLARSLVFFPFVGLLIGACAYLALKSCFRLDLGAFAYAIVPVFVLAALTGGLHLDGLSDTADALGSGKDREGMLAVMRDPRCGALGVATLVFAILLKVAFFQAIPLMYRGKALLLACTCGRWPILLSLYFFPYARQDGKALAYSRGINGRVLLAGGALAVLCALSAGAKGVLVLAAVSLIVMLFNMKIKERIGGITGDTLGASVEIAEICAFFLAVFIF